MSRVLLTEQVVGLAGLAPTFTPADALGAGGGFRFTITGEQYCRIKNTSGSPVTATIKVPITVGGGLTITEPTVTIPATTGDMTIRPLDPTYFAQASGEVYIEVSAFTNVSAAVFR